MITFDEFLERAKEHFVSGKSKITCRLFGWKGQCCPIAAGCFELDPDCTPTTYLAAEITGEHHGNIWSFVSGFDGYEYESGWDLGFFNKGIGFRLWAVEKGLMT